MGLLDGLIAGFGVAAPGGGLIRLGTAAPVLRVGTVVVTRVYLGTVLLTGTTSSGTVGLGVYFQYNNPQPGVDAYKAWAATS